MKIEQNYPSFIAFRENEINTLNFLNTRPILKQYETLTNTIQTSYLENFSKAKKYPNSDFVFHCDFEMDVEGHKHIVIVGANVLYGFSICSYFLAVVDKENTELIRKFHFDFALPSISTTNKVPTFHLQYGGKMSPQLVELGFNSDKLDHWLSLPRLNFSPINLALLLDMLFCEFRTEETNKIVEDPDWRSLIYINEKFISCNYFENIYRHITSSAYKKETLLRDFCYGT